MKNAHLVEVERHPHSGKLRCETPKESCRKSTPACERNKVATLAQHLTSIGWYSFGINLTAIRISHESRSETSASKRAV